MCEGGENEPYAQPGYYPLVRGAFVQCTPRLACRGGRNASCSPLYTGDRCAQCALGAYRCGEAAGDAIAVVSPCPADGRVCVVLCVLTGRVAPSTIECLLHVYPPVLSSVVPTQERRPGVRLASSRLTPLYHGPHASACMCTCECMCVAGCVGRAASAPTLRGCCFYCFRWGWCFWWGCRCTSARSG